MPARLVICPVDIEIGVDGVTRRQPRVLNTPDPGKLSEDGITPVTCVASTGGCISSGQPGEENDFCLCLAVAIDMSGLDADPEIITLFDLDDDQTLDAYRLWIESTPKSLGWAAAKVNNTKGKLDGRGVFSGDLTENSRLWEFANRLGRKFGPFADVRKINPVGKRAGA